MGTGGSKFKKSKPQKVVAEIIVPGQSAPIKVKGQVNISSDDISQNSGAKVKEVGPNKFSIQLGNQDVATFNTDTDFHAYLTNAAELKVTNIETVPDEDNDGSGEADHTMFDSSYSFQLTPSSSDDYSDDEDWSDIINNIDDQSSSDEIDGADNSEAKQRKTQLKKTLQAKRANLSPEEYQQMISNHKQEMELMEMLRQKELDRQKNSLASKVADRKKKRLAMKQEAMQKNQLTTQVTNIKVEKELEKQTVEESEMEKLKLHVLTQTNTEMEEEINQRNKDFDEQMRDVRPFISEKEYRKLLLQHKAQVGALSRKLEIGKNNQRIHLMEKLAQRCKRGTSDKKTEKPPSSEEVKELQLALNTKEVDFRKDLTRTRSTLTGQESERLIKEHKQEMQVLQQQLEVDRTNMQQNLIKRLKARMKNDQTQEGTFFSAEDLKQLQLVIDSQSQTANNELKKQKNNLSKDEYSKLMTNQRNERETLQRHLESEKTKTDEWLRRKMATRSLRIDSSNSMIKWADVLAAAANYNEQQLEKELNQCKESWEKDKKEKKSVLQPEEYDALMKQYQEEVTRLEERLNRQTNAQRQHLLDKLAERRAKKNNNAMAMTADEVKEMQLAIAGKDVSFKAEIKRVKCEKSNEEVQKLINQHKEEMNSFQKQLDLEREKMRETLLAKVAARQRKGLSDEDESLTDEEIKQSQVALDGRDTIFKENIKQTKSVLTSEDYHILLDNHLTEQQQLQKHLEKEREKMNASLSETIKNRYAREKKEVNAAAIQARMDAARAEFEQQSKKKNITDEEYQQLLQEHENEMKRLQGLLDMSIDRQKLHMMDRLDARRKRKALVNAEEEEKQRLLLLLGKEDLTMEEIEQVIDDLEEYEVAAQENLEAKKSQMSVEDYQKLLAAHQKEMEAFQRKLDEQKKDMGAKLAVRLAARSKLQTEILEEEQMQEFSVLENSVDVSSLAVTQLWTTPVQSKALVVVPLPEEYPVRKKRQLYTDAAIFRDLDTHAIKLAQIGSLVTYPTFSALVDELMRIGTSELEKARLAFRWITAQNCDEMDLSEVVDDTPLGVLKGIYFNKITFSTLFMRMCRFIGLRCVEINGCAKVKGYKPGMFISLEDHNYLHTWNAIRIDGHWHFVDCNWGVSHIAGSVTFDPFRFEYDEHYFLADPEVIIATHFPNEGAWQLLPQPLTLKEFNCSVVLKPDFFKFNFQLLNLKEAVVHVKTGTLDLRIGHPQGFILSCKIVSLDRETDKTLNGISFYHFVFVHQVAENQMSIYIRFPEVGKFFVVVYAKKQYVNGQVNFETETEICRYNVISDAPSVDQYPLPSSPVDHWGPIGVGNAGLVPITHRTAVIVSNREPITIGFKFTQHLIFHHELTCQEKDPLTLQSYVMHRKFNCNVLFTITPPHASRFGINIYITYPNDPQQQKVHLCSYLLVVNAVEETNVLPIPILSRGYWGETRAFTNLGLTALSHPDPFITVPSGDSLSINIGISEEVFLQHRLEYYHDKSFSNLTSTTHAQSSKGCISFLLHLPKKGYYVFKILGSNSNEEGMPMSVCFDYLIKRY
ncbi:uncharacterized protein PFB0765w-like isoform X2 [Anneissia japonica]|uniref:uncharacterized protein PFB0765w-like isoform X2 n=1 Tax=Anneissia japonica TaxID=1529436 RepID=UPI001425A9EB|nr:uncharacterized protein PFB0765w-like isoform X2 [Anneissia japonica]